MARRARNGHLQFVHLLAARGQLAAGMESLKAAGQLVEVAAFGKQAAADYFAQLRRNLRHAARAGKDAFGQNLRPGGGRGRAEVGGKIADGKVDFMADGREDRNSRVDNGAGHDLLERQALQLDSGDG